MGQINKSFDYIVHNEKIKELSVVIYADSFFYGLWDEEMNLLKSDQHDLANFSRLLRVWNNNYNLEMVRILSTQKPFTHVHETHFDIKYFKHYFKGQYDVRKRRGFNKEVDLFQENEIMTLHYIPKEMVKALNQYDFPFKISHVSSALARYASQTKNELIVFVNSTFLHVAYIDENQFKFYNQFYFEDSKDVLYYVLMTMQAFELEPSTDKVTLGGHISENSPLIDQLKGYLGNIEMINEKLISDKITDIENQFLFDLYLSKTCVS